MITRKGIMQMNFNHIALVGGTLSRDECFLLQSRLHFMVSDIDSVSISYESGGRIRVDTYTGTLRVGTIGWAFAADDARLVELVRDAQHDLLYKETPVV